MQVDLFGGPLAELRHRQRDHPQLDPEAASVNGEPTYTRAGRWVVLVGLIVVCLIAGLALPFGGYIGGRGLATASGDPGQSRAMWVGAGLAIGAPVAALHRLGFPVSTRASLTCAAGLAVVITVGGSLLSR